MPDALASVLREVDYLKNISERLETLADIHPSLGDGFVTVAGNVRNIATVLEVFTLVRGKFKGLEERLTAEPMSPFVM